VIFSDPSLLSSSSEEEDKEDKEEEHTQENTPELFLFLDDEE